MAGTATHKERIPVIDRTFLSHKRFSTFARCAFSLPPSTYFQPNKMDSPCESESSLDGGAMLPLSPVSREQLQKRIESLTQQNK